jgi:hypothetical protein
MSLKYEGRNLVGDGIGAVAHVNDRRRLVAPPRGGVPDSGWRVEGGGLRVEG